MRGLATSQGRDSLEVSRMSEVQQDSLALSDQAVSLPQVTFKPTIHYPDEARAYGKKAFVWVKLRVDTLGQTSNYSVIKTPNRSLDAAAIMYAKQYRFSAGSLDGKKSVMTIAVQIEFDP